MEKEKVGSDFKLTLGVGAQCDKPYPSHNGNEKNSRGGKRMTLGGPKPYSFFASCVTQGRHNGKILNDTFRVDSFASTGFSARSSRQNDMYNMQEN